MLTAHASGGMSSGQLNFDSRTLGVERLDSIFLQRPDFDGRLECGWVEGSNK